MNSELPLLAITSGDPAGIGPEVTVKALNDPVVYDKCRPLVISDGGIIEQIISLCNLQLQVNTVNHPSEGTFRYGIVDVLNLYNINMINFRFNEAAAMTGKASFDYVAKAIELALAHEIDGTVTGPIHKEALQKAGIRYPGHTEIYAAYTKTDDYTMMLADEHFKVVHVSTHLSLSEAIRCVKKTRIVKVIRLANEALFSMGIGKPRIAVAGLNPHAGEHGLFGREETDEIIPAVEQTQKEGINVEGPFPPDTIFPKMRGGQYDVVVCMYHDQGHIPMKLLGFSYNNETGQWDTVSGVNITLGLPIVRVSVDHGTAFDKGGRNMANPQSMLQAIDYAARMSVKRGITD